MKKSWLEIGQRLFKKINIEVRPIKDRWQDQAFCLKKGKAEGRVKIQILHNEILDVQVRDLHEFAGMILFENKRMKKIHDALKQWFMMVAKEEKVKAILVDSGVSEEWMAPYKLNCEVTRAFSGYGLHYFNIEQNYLEKRNETIQQFISDLLSLGSKTTAITKMDYNKMTLYHKGCFADIDVCYKKESLSLQYNEKEFDSTENGIKNMLKKIEEFGRIKNILDPPKHHLKNVLSQEFTISGINAIHSYLLEHYTYEEIEEYCVCFLEENAPLEMKKMETFNLIILHFMDLYFLCTKGGKIEMVKTKEDIKEKANEMMFLYVKEVAGKELDGIIQELKSTQIRMFYNKYLLKLEKKG